MFTGLRIFRSIFYLETRGNDEESGDPRKMASKNSAFTYNRVESVRLFSTHLTITPKVQSEEIERRVPRTPRLRYVRLGAEAV